METNLINNKGKVIFKHHKESLQKDRYIATSLMMIAGGFILFFLLVCGSYTDNRFGTHLVFSGNLTSSPDWYISIINLISITIMLIGAVSLIASLINRKGIMNANQQRVIRAGSLALMGVASISIGLSSTVFAAFNNNFFFGPTVTLKSDTFLGLQTISLQSFVIALLSIAGIFAVIITTGVLAIRSAGMSRKAYTSIRNAGLIMAAAGWFVFNFDLMAFGALGGDANVLISGLAASLGHDDLDIAAFFANENHNLESIANFLDQAEDVTAEQFGNLITPIIGNLLGGSDLSAIKPVVSSLWDNAKGLVAAPAIKILNEIHEGLGTFIKGQGGFQPLILNISSLVREASTVVDPIFNWLGDLSKPSLLEGVNESLNAFLILGLLSLFVVILGPLYGILDYRNKESDGNTIVYRTALYSLILLILVFTFSALVIPYIPGGKADVNNYSLLNALITGNGAGIAPGLIAPAGVEGGINTAVVYFSPNYHGTITWFILLGAVIAVPFISFFVELIFKTRNKIKLY